MNKEIIGTRAGIAWRTIAENGGKLSVERLSELAKLGPVELATAIGWLAREDKIAFSDENGVSYVEVFHETYY